MGLKTDDEDKMMMLLHESAQCCNVSCKLRMCASLKLELKPIICCCGINGPSVMGHASLQNFEQLRFVLSTTLRYLLYKVHIPACMIEGRARLYIT